MFHMSSPRLGLAAGCRVVRDAAVLGPAREGSTPSGLFWYARHSCRAPIGLELVD